MTGFNPQFTITHRMTSAITQIERARGFLEAARLSDDWVRDMGNQALIKEAHHTTHIEGTRLTLDQAERLWKGEAVPEADPDDTRELLNYRSAFEFVSIKDFEGLCPEVNRRSLQRDLKAFLEKGLIKETGAGPTDPTRHYVLS